MRVSIEPRRERGREGRRTVGRGPHELRGIDLGASSDDLALSQTLCWRTFL